MNENSSWKQALDRTRRAALGRISALLGATEITPAVWEEMESLLLQADLGPRLTQQIIALLLQKTRDEGITDRTDLDFALRGFLGSLLGAAESAAFQETPSVLLIVGVNGSGKMTTIAKLARRFSGEGKRVLLAAADTFGAAASDQLAVWAGRLGLELIAGAGFRPGRGRPRRGASDAFPQGGSPHRGYRRPATYQRLPDGGIKEGA
jgi:fused signal recognition particle receptor